MATTKAKSKQPSKLAVGTIVLGAGELAAIRRAVGIAARSKMTKELYPTFARILMGHGHCRAFNGQVGIVVYTNIDLAAGALSLPADRLNAFLTALGMDAQPLLLSVNQGGNTSRLSFGSAALSLEGVVYKEEVHQLPGQLPKPGAYDELPEGFLPALRAAVFSSSEDMMKVMFYGVRILGVKDGKGTCGVAYSTDGLRVARVEFSGHVPKALDGVFLPRYLCEDLVSQGTAPKGVAGDLAGNRLWFNFSDSVVYGQLLSVVPPDCEKVVSAYRKAHSENSVQWDLTDSARSSFARASVLSKDSQSPVILRLDSLGSKMVHVQTQAAGESFTDQADIGEVRVVGKVNFPVQIKVNGEFLVAASTRGSRVSFADGALMFSSESRKGAGKDAPRRFEHLLKVLV